MVMNPPFPEMLAVAVQDPEIIAYAKDHGAEGITLAGICCTANEILMRHGIPVAGNFLQQELAIITGAIETMIIDVTVLYAEFTCSRQQLSYENCRYFRNRLYYRCRTFSF